MKMKTKTYLFLYCCIGGLGIRIIDYDLFNTKVGQNKDYLILY